MLGYRLYCGIFASLISWSRYHVDTDIRKLAICKLVPSNLYVWFGLPYNSPRYTHSLSSIPQSYLLACNLTIMALADHSTMQSADNTTLQTPEESSYVSPIKLLPPSKMNLESESQPTRRISIHTLPNELLLLIFGHLDGPQPSASHLAVYDEPRFDLTQSGITDLKSISCVSKRWREAVLPVLFRHPQLIITDTKTNGDKLPSEIKLFFHFITQHRLCQAITTFTLICYNQNFKSIYNRDTSHVLSNFWTSLFGVIDPIDLLIVAPSQALGFLTACPVNVDDSWCFDCPCQYLRLQRRPTRQVGERTPDPDRDSDQETTSIPTPYLTPNVYGELPNPVGFYEEDPEENVFADASVLFDRPWSKLLLNEGSFIRAYATDEFWTRQPPSVCVFCK